MFLGLFKSLFQRAGPQNELENLPHAIGRQTKTKQNTMGLKRRDVGVKKSVLRCF